MDADRDAISKAIQDFFLQPQESRASLAETYWVNTKTYPNRTPVALANDPVAMVAFDKAQETTGVLERVVQSGGKRYRTFPIQRLPRPIVPPGTSLRSAFQQRASTRKFDSKRPIGLRQISTILHYTYGWNDTRSRQHGAFKHVPSAGGLYPLEFYVVTTNALGLGGNTVHHYRPTGHILEALRTFDPATLVELFAASPWVASANAVIFITGVLDRLTWKYGDRALRYLLIDAGHAAQNACLAAAALQVGACTIVDFYDDSVHDFLDVDGMSENVVYAIALGTLVPQADTGHKQGR